MKIVLQYPWKFKDSAYYKYLLENPPKNVEYIGNEKKDLILDKKIFWFFDKSKKIIKLILKILNLEKANAHLTKYDGQYDLIHCAHCLSKNKDKPWIADIEMYGSLFIAKKRSNKLDREIKEIILRKNCKKILPWSEGVKKSIIQHIPEIESKVETLYPAISLQKENIKKTNKIPKIIFISRYFYTKGGLMALEVMKELKDKCKCLMVSNVPDSLKKNYPFVEFHALMPRDQLFSLMENADILLYPVISDTFGFSLLESMSFGIPIVALETLWTKSIGEIVRNGKTGFLIKTKKIPSQQKIGILEKDLIKQLSEKCLILIENKNLRKQMSKECLREIKEGKFSINERNKKLGKIYEEALE